MPYSFNHIQKRYSNAKEWIPEEVWMTIPRVSEVVNALTCDWTSWDNDVNRIKRDEKPMNIDGSNYPALKGTIGHYYIEEFIRAIMGMETDPLELRPQEQRLLVQLKKNGQLDGLYDEAKRSFDNFEKWWEAYNPVPIFPEKEIVHIKYKTVRGMKNVVDPTRSVKGTMDFIGEINLSDVSRNALIEMKKEKKTLKDFTQETFTAIIDWKTGTQALSGHQVQLTGYHYLLTDSGMWADAVKNKEITSPYLRMKEHGISSSYAMCIKFGGSKYLNTMYDVDNKEFFRAWDRFNSPTPTAYSVNQRTDTKLKMLCLFCEHRVYNCPMYATKPIELELLQ